MKVQIIVPAINLWAKYTKPCIESINTSMVAAAAHQIETRLLFIDNASTDETREEASKMVSSVFCHQRNEERWGFQRSVNFGVNDAFERGFDIALVCNNDIVLHPEAIGRIVEGFLRSFEIDGRVLDVGMVTCMDVRGEMQEKGIPPTEIARLIALDKEEVSVALHPNFSAFAVSQKCWEEVGEFDELFFPAYFEDNDYHYRMKLSKVDGIIYPPAMFFHYGSRTQNEANENKTPMVPGPLFENARANFAKKWGGAPGSEKWEHPYDNIALDWRSTEQGRAKQTS